MVNILATAPPRLINILLKDAGNDRINLMFIEFCQNGRIEFAKIVFEKLDFTTDKTINFYGECYQNTLSNCDSYDMLFKTIPHPITKLVYDALYKSFKNGYVNTFEWLLTNFKKYHQMNDKIILSYLIELYSDQLVDLVAA